MFGRKSVDLDRTMKMDATINEDHDSGVHNENVNINDDTFLDYDGDERWKFLSRNGLGVSIVADAFSSL